MILNSLLTFFLICPVILAHRAGYEPGPFQINRRFSYSTHSPLVKAINELAPAAIPHVDFINQHFTLVENAVLASLKGEGPGDDPIKPCDPLIRWNYRSSISRNFAMRGFPEPAWNCGTDVFGVNTGGKPPGYTLDDLYNAIFNRGAEVKKKIREISKRVTSNFTNPEVPYNFSYSTGSARCALTPVCMFRVGDVWHQGLGINNYGIDEFVADGSRISVHEHFRVVDGKLGDNLLMRLPVYDDGTIERVFLENSTSMIQRWARNPNPSCFRLIHLEENPALLDALSQVDHSVQLAEDAVTSSNLAILVLPLWLNLIPVAFFADVSTHKMLMYTLLSDVLTVIPLATKGLELVLISSRRFRSVVSRIMTPIKGSEPFPNAAGGEVWGAECRVRSEVGRTGVILLITAAVFFVVGIAGEIVARAYVQRRRRARRKLASRSDSFISFEGSNISAPFSDPNAGAIGAEIDRYSDYERGFGD